MINEKLRRFPSCHSINLIECTDRKEYMIGKFEELGVENYKIHSFERPENTDLKFLGTKEVLYNLPIGTASSHLLAIKWWYENTDEEMAAFFEDDCDFSTIDHWNFVFEDFLKKMGPLWDGLQLCVMHEGWPVMFPRRRNGFDHGLQCYIIKRHYAKKIIDFYFLDDKTIHFRTTKHYKLEDRHKPLNATVENIVYGLGLFYIHPLFNHNIKELNSVVWSENNAKSDTSNAMAKKSYEYVKAWWENKGSKGTLEELFDFKWCCAGNQNYLNVYPIDD